MTSATSTYVLDSFALLAFFQDEPGGPRVRELLERSARGEVTLALTTVNLAEVVYRTERTLGLERAQEVLAKIAEFDLALATVDRELALAAAHLKARHTMSYADCLVAALALQLDAAIVTGDRDFQQLEDTVAIEWLRGAR